MSPVEQHETARERANEVRLARADLKRKLKARKRFLPDVLTAEIPDWLDNMPTSDLLDAVPSLPKKRIYEFLYTANLSESRTVEHTTVRQRNLLAELVGEWEAKRKRARPHRTTGGLRRSKRGQS